MINILSILSILWIITFNLPSFNHRCGITTVVYAVSSTTTNVIHFNAPNLPVPPSQKRVFLINSPSISIIATSMMKRKGFHFKVWNCTKRYHRRYQVRCAHSLPNGICNQLPRGGAISTTIPADNLKEDKKTVLRKKKKKKKKKTQPSKQVINEVLKDEDSAAKSLGDAIRQNAHLLLNRDHDYDDTTTVTLESLGYAMGSSDYTTSVLSKYYQNRLRESVDLKNNGVSRRTKSKMAQELTSPTAVIAHYFLKSHGGIHFLQCMCSLLATLAGMGGVLLSKNRSLQYTLIQRTLFFAMCKHIAGVIMAIYLLARPMPRPGGFTEATQSIQSLIRDPISQYVFYTACVAFWIPSSPTKTATMSSTPSLDNSSGGVGTSTKESLATLVWWQQQSWVPLLLVGPVVLREFVSTALVISDVLTLVIATTAGADTATATYVQRLLNVLQAIVNAGMSILVTPKKWKLSNAAQRQAILAKLVSKISLLMEVGVGMLMLCDCLLMTLQYLFVNTGGRIRFYALMKSMICTRLYIGFLLTRRKNISKLVESIRGGAVGAPLYVLDIILHPTTSMGIGLSQYSSTIDMNNSTAQNSSQPGSRIEKNSNWLDSIRIALDMDTP